ncbi:MAG: hypothetical protein ACT4OP_08825, partial [Actinomycetota bacterium]
VREERNQLDDQLDTRQKLLALKSRLGQLITSGNVLYADKQMTVQEAEMWATPVAHLIASALGEEEAQLFLSDAGYTFLAGGDSNQRLWIEGRLRRLNELVARADAMTIRSEFRL